MTRLVAALLLVFCAPALSHEASTSYLYWHSERANTLRLDIALTDVMLHLNPDIPATLTWGELKGREHAIAQRLLDGLTVKQGENACQPSATLNGLTHYTDETFSVWQVHWRCPENTNILKPVTLNYRLLFDQDSLHRAVLTRDAPGMWLLPSGIQVLKPDSPPAALLPPVGQTTTNWFLAALLTAIVLLALRLRRSS